MRSHSVATRILAIVILALSLSGCMRLALFAPGRGPEMVLETLIPAESRWNDDKVLLLAIDGMLSARADRGGWVSRPGTLVLVKDVLQRAEKDPSIRAVVLRIDSPGGSVTASDLIYTEIKAFKERTGKKVVAACMGVAASGGYYVAMAGDRVLVHPTTVTGSIGVIGLFPDLAGLSGKFGFDMRVVKSGEHKDMGSMWRPFSEEERGIFQAMIDEMYERFLSVIVEGRPKLAADTIRRLADGRVYTAKQAVGLGLADEIGYLDDAFARAKQLAGLPDAALVTYKRPYSYRGHYYASSQSAEPARAAQPTEFNLLHLDLTPSAAFPEGGPFHYLWLP
jgi:protease IV